MDLKQGPDEGGPQSAIDLLNVSLDREDAVRTRDGYSKLNSVATASSLDYVTIGDSGNFLIGIGHDGKIYPISMSTGAVSAASSFIASLYPKAALFGTGSSRYVYVPGVTCARVASGTTVTQPAGMPSAVFLAVQPGDNRMIAINPGDIITSGTLGSRIAFSAPGDAETWNNPTAAVGTAGDYVELGPHDGEALTSPVVWNNQLFVFKQSKFYVFYGNSTDADGNAVFNYRTVNNGVGAVYDPTGSAAAAPDGVYFTGSDGIYRTTGGNPVKVSGPLDPLFTGASTPFFSYAGPPTINRGMTYLHGHVYSTLTCDGTNYITLVYNIAAESWTVWQLGHTPTNVIAAPYAINVRQPDRMTFANGTFVYTSQPSDTTDAGTAIASRYRSSFYTPIGAPSQECKILESVLEGRGAPSFSVSHDYGAVPTTGGGAKTSVTLGTAPAYARGKHRKSQKGRRFSYQIEASSGAWQVNSIVQHVRSIRPPGVKST